MAKRGVGSIGDSRLIAGLIIEKRLDLDRLPKSLDAGKVVVLSCPLEIESTVRDVEIEVDNPEKWASFMDIEEERLQHKAQQIISSGANLVFTAEGVEPRILHALVDEGIFVLGNLEKSGAEDIALATGAQMIDHLDDISEEALGNFTQLKIETLEGAEGRRERIHLLVGQQTGIATIDVGGGDGVASEEVIRGLYDALCSVTSAMETGEVLTGAGSLHMAAALAIKEAAENQSGRERLSMEAFARALESIPATLGENAGVNRLDCLLELRALHRGGNSEAGILRDGKAGTIDEALASAETLSHAIEAACETACGLLRVDQVISARGD
jgi:chaperonin GroEL (HSP60 family)